MSDSFLKVSSPPHFPNNGSSTDINFSMAESYNVKVELLSCRVTHFKVFLFCFLFWINNFEGFLQKHEQKHAQFVSCGVAPLANMQHYVSQIKFKFKRMFIDECYVMFISESLLSERRQGHFMWEHWSNPLAFRMEKNFPGTTSMTMATEEMPLWNSDFIMGFNKLHFQSMYM